jgi:hypothetical protein
MKIFTRKKKFSFLLLIVGIIFSQNISAQNASVVELNVGLDGAIPVRNEFSEQTSFGLGGDVKLGVELNKNIAVLLSGGFVHFYNSDKRKKADLSALDLTDITLAIRYKIFSSLYIEPHAGLGLLSADPADDNGFAYACYLGYFFTKYKIVDVSVRYAGSTNGLPPTYVGIRIGVRLPPGRFL